MTYLYNSLAVIFTTLAMVPAVAQNASTDRDRQVPPYAIVKLAPLSLIDIDATLQGAIEFPISNQTTFQIEGGYGWPGLSRSSRDDNGVSHKQTWRVRAEVRHYIPRTAPTDAYPYATGLYIAGEALVKQISAERPQLVAFPCSNAPCPATTQTAFINRNILGGHVKLGYQTGFGILQNSQGLSRLVFDIYAGVGARHIRVRQSIDASGIPINDTGLRALGFTRFVPGRGFWAGSLSGGFKIG